MNGYQSAILESDNVNVYQRNGYGSRTEYLESLADEHGISFETVSDLADLLGEVEDFDGLVNACQDAEAMGYN
jgi:hypothetical protein